MKVHELKKLLESSNDNDEVILFNASSEWYGAEPIDNHLQKEEGFFIVNFGVDFDEHEREYLEQYKAGNINKDNTVMWR